MIQVKPDPRAVEPETVELAEGHVFTLRTLTRSVRTARETYSRDVVACETTAQVIVLIGALLDALLESAPGKRKKPSVILTEKYDADAWTEDQINGLLDAILEAQDTAPTADPT